MWKYLQVRCRASNLVPDASQSRARWSGVIVIYRETRCLGETPVSGETARYRGNYRKGDRLGRSKGERKKEEERKK